MKGLLVLVIVCGLLSSSLGGKFHRRHFGKQQLFRALTGQDRIDFIKANCDTPTISEEQNNPQSNSGNLGDELERFDNLFLQKLKDMQNALDYAGTGNEPSPTVIDAAHTTLVCMNEDLNVRFIEKEYTDMNDICPKGSSGPSGPDETVRCLKENVEELVDQNEELHKAGVSIEKAVMAFSGLMTAAWRIERGLMKLQNLEQGGSRELVELLQRVLQDLERGGTGSESPINVLKYMQDNCDLASVTPADDALPVTTKDMIDAIDAADIEALATNLKSHLDEYTGDLSAITDWADKEIGDILCSFNRVMGLLLHYDKAGIALPICSDRTVDETDFEDVADCTLANVNEALRMKEKLETYDDDAAEEEYLADYGLLFEASTRAEYGFYALMQLRPTVSRRDFLARLGK